MSNAQPMSFNISFFDMRKAKRNFTTARRYVVGYARLSFDEDGDNFVSIENQMSILEDFYHQQYENATSEYLFIADDNVSGYKFERDGLYQLITLIEEGKCNIILAKDLSRIGRHGALTQLFIEQCERVGIRIHAMSDYDSTKESDDLILGIRAWSNERVVKDTSAKIKKIVQHKQTNGTWFCAAPFGYYVIDYQKGRVGIDEEPAAIVRRIFDMYLNGAGLTSIARTLTREHVPTPNMFSRERAIANGDEFKKRVSADWQPAFISTILSNEFYIGTLVTGRYQRDGINGKDVRTDREAWNKFENHHEAIIDRETFDAVQAIKESHSKYNFRPKDCCEHLFHGIVFCGECGSVEYAYATKRLATQYVCSTYFKYGRERCTRHRIKESLLINIAINFLKLARESCKEAIDSLDGELFPKRAVKNNEEAIGRMEKELAGLDAQLQIIEEQRIKQIIAHPERESSINTIYDGMVETTQRNRDELAERLEHMKVHLTSTAASIKKAKKAIDVIDQVIESGTLTRRAILAIFDRITVHEDGNIDIELKPYLKILDPVNYSIAIKPHKQPEENYTISSESTAVAMEHSINDDSDGDGFMMERRLKPSAKELSRVRVAEIHANPYQPRALFDEESIRALARSIEENGLLSPLLLRRGEGNGYTLIAGERRLRALRVLGRNWVDAIVMDADEVDMRALSLIENIQREQLTFLEEAQAMRELLRETGVTQEALARRLGRSPSSVANLLRLLRLPETVRRAIGEEKLTERHARALLKLDGDEKVQLDAVRRITRGQLNVRQTDALIESLLREKRAASCRVKGVVRDARMFVNAISGTVEKLRKVGVNAALRVEETSDSVEIFVTLRKGVREERKG